MARTWYLVHCKPQQQSRAELNLGQQGFEFYAPQHPVKKLLRGKVETRNEALFPGYVFVCMQDDSPWQSLKATRGVSRIVSFNGQPHPVPVELIEGLRQRLSHAQTPAPLFHQGERVTITEGCFKHIDAIVKGVTADERIIVLLRILQSEQTLAINPASLARAS